MAASPILPRWISILALTLVFVSAWRAVGFHQSDEHYQILEFAAMRAGHTPVEDLPWEYTEQMRPGLQPLLAYGVYRLLGDPFWTAWLLRLLSGLFTLAVAALLFRRLAPTIEKPNWISWFGGLCFLHWAMLYSGLRFASESWSGLTFALAFLWYLPLMPRVGRYEMPRGWGRRCTSAGRNIPQQEDGNRVAVARLMLIGFLLGLSINFRYQAGLLVAGLGLWLLVVGRERPGRLACLAVGGLLALALGVLADRWLYGQWVNAPWNYLAQNLIEGKAATFGTRPWWGYFELVFLRGIPAGGLTYVVVPLLFFWRYRRDPLTWAWLPFLLVHIYLSRKDVRFLFPLLPLLPIAYLGVARWLTERWQHWEQSRWTRWTVILLLILNFGIVAFNSWRPLRPSIQQARRLYYDLPAQAVIVSRDRPFYFFDLPQHFYRRSGWTVVEQCPPGETCIYPQSGKDH